MGSCGNHNPSKPVVRDPVIISLDAFPTMIGPNDSALVICRAVDPDADTLFYDWITDDRLRLKGARVGDPFLYNSLSPLQVIYPQQQYLHLPDTTWVRCDATDGHGHSASRLVHIVIHP